MKNIKYLGTLLLLAMAWACSNDNEIVKPESVQPVSDGITFTATFGVKNGTSRALSDPGDGTLKASWQQGEEIAIVFGGNKYTATVTEVDADGSATVTATLPAGTPNNQKVIYIYPASAADGNGLRGDVLSSQDGTFATLSSTLDIATANGTLVVDGTTAQPNGTVTLMNQFAICKFQFKDASDHAIEDITKLTITDLSTTEKITVTTPSAQSAVYVAMLPSNNSTKFEVETGSGHTYTKIANAHIEAGKFYHPTLQMMSRPDNSGTIDGKAYVDLWLPSGTLWATCNVGADSPEEYGDYFAWGETTPKSNYNWDTYRFCVNGQNSMLWKYCLNSDLAYVGETDGLSELLPADDAATANWGSGWQMPSLDQFMELVNGENTTSEWTTENGVNGRRVTSKGNGNSIFLPVAGYYTDAGLQSAGSYGYNWTRTLMTGFSNKYNYRARSVLFHSGGFTYNTPNDRCNGLTVRPVRTQ